MNAADHDFLDDRDDHSVQQQDTATGYRADNDKGATEQSLKGNALFGQGKMAEVREGQPMGGHTFNQEGNPTPMGDDKDNPSRMAGYTNAYFARTEPLIEDTANNNFKAAHQQGEPDYDAAQPNVPGPQEVPDQQKVGEDNENNGGADRSDIDPGLDEPQPDHGSNDTETGEEKDHIET